MIRSSAGRVARRSISSVSEGSSTASPASRSHRYVGRLGRSSACGSKDCSGDPAFPLPVINLGHDGVNGTPAAAGQTAYRQATRPLPPLHGAEVSFEVGGDCLPGIQPLRSDLWKHFCSTRSVHAFSGVIICLHRPSPGGARRRDDNSRQAVAWPPLPRCRSAFGPDLG